MPVAAILILNDLSALEKTMKHRVCLFCLILLFGVGCEKNKAYYLSGRTMGTTYHITLISERDPESFDLAEKINQRLDAINHSMSLFDDSSELSRFNALKKGQSFCVSEDFWKVFQTGETLYLLSLGAWDGSIGPLVNLWGFGHDPKADHIPDESAIQSCLGRIGFNRIEHSGDHCLVKTVDGLVLDFGSIAKGFAVDRVTELILENGIRDCLVEIGGEVRASGTKQGAVWTVGINTPAPDAPINQVMTTIELSDRSIATSGDYRNFRVDQGKSYTHVIDPKTGWPVRNSVASVSVLADNDVFADGLATALMVMGEEKGLALVNRLDQVECLFILKTDEGRFRTASSSGWPQNP